ncbi:MAG TPA: DUF3109 family protein [Candidatus Kapabacteria bacterium]|nr:DUF3109 family protein [Ignavibacteria bacterium]HRK59142.1 DUF3109 family protein [Candidatus Kapabacteria bacterium]
MFLIDSILIDERIITDQFLCDTQQCKGACCTLSGGGGAPLRESEVRQIESALPHALTYLTNESAEYIRVHGFVQTNDDGSLETHCIDNTDCVFVYYDNNIAKCSLEKAYNNELTTFKKPISCHLFPLRVRNFGGDFLSYEPFDECHEAIENGKKNNVAIVHFLKEPIIRLYGEQWYNRLLTHAQSSMTSSGEIV